MPNFIIKLIAIVSFFCLADISTSYAKDTSYKIGMGDVLEIKVFGETEFSGTFRISSDGTFEYPFLKKIPGAGKTTEELAKRIMELLKDGYLLDPQVSVEVKDFRSQNVLVLGAVARPGTYNLQEETRVIDIISKAGGLSTAGGKKIVLLRNENVENKNNPAAPPGETTGKGENIEPKITPNSTPIIIDYYKLVHEGDFSQNVVLQNGDILNIPKANEIFVLGNVSKPGPVPYEENMTILQAVTLAGGPTPLASPKSTYILRQGPTGEVKIEIRLDKILNNKAKNEILKADDVIVIPESFF